MQVQVTVVITLAVMVLAGLSVPYVNGPGRWIMIGLPLGTGVATIRWLIGLGLDLQNAGGGKG